MYTPLTELREMEGLKELMSLIDANSDKLSEGDYLLMCNAMREVHGNMKTKRDPVRTEDYYEYELQLSRVTNEITRLHAESDKLHYRRKLTKFMKVQAMMDHALKLDINISRDVINEKIFRNVGVRVNFPQLYAQYMEDFNREIFDKKKDIHRQVEEERVYRDEIVCLLAVELNE
jgi:hypothetical protein